MRSILSWSGAAALLLVATGCGSDGGEAAGSGRPQVVVTTSILGDVVRQVVGEQADVTVIMPIGADPHEFAASTRQAEAMVAADLLVVNGAGFEQGLGGLIEGAARDGTPLFTFADHVTLRTLDGVEHEHGAEDDDHAAGEDHAAEEHHEGGEDPGAGEDHGAGEDQAAEEDHGAVDAGDDHDHEGGDDPHLWTDPTMIAGALDPLVAGLGALDGIDAAALAESASAYRDQLVALDAEITAVLAPIPEDRRVLVTNHEALGYFAHRYDLAVIGTVIPSLTTSANASAADLEELADVVRSARVPAIFGETTQPSQLADALADEVGGDVQVVELYTESLGEEGSGADSYLGMLRTDAERIAGALT